jgi:hypothetical protein
VPVRVAFDLRDPRVDLDADEGEALLGRVVDGLAVEKERPPEVRRSEKLIRRQAPGLDP